MQSFIRRIFSGITEYQLMLITYKLEERAYILEEKYLPEKQEELQRRFEETEYFINRKDVRQAKLASQSYARVQSYIETMHEQIRAFRDVAEFVKKAKLDAELQQSMVEIQTALDVVRKLYPKLESEDALKQMVDHAKEISASAPNVSKLANTTHTSGFMDQTEKENECASRLFQELSEKHGLVESLLLPSTSTSSTMNELAHQLPDITSSAVLAVGIPTRRKTKTKRRSDDEDDEDDDDDDPNAVPPRPSTPPLEAESPPLHREAQVGSLVAVRRVVVHAAEPERLVLRREDPSTRTSEEDFDLTDLWRRFEALKQP
jgi:hypothetical protein